MLSIFLREERGQDLIEYALMLALVAVAGGVMIPPVGVAVSTIFTKAMSVLARFGG
ncbi:MAG: Flp family type IVb pilin [Acidobacteria bacterium]|nr:Flp family type IVb pilin [Acidobacteriota bacterium]MBM3749350.1 Flp family type IVb pilin [Acidobacteriota bacterium]